MSQTNLGTRYNTGKLRYGLFSAFANKIKAMIYTLGTAKYDDRNWEKGMKFSTLLDSAQRHVALLMSGEDIDPDSGLPHSSHAAWNLEAVTHMMIHHPELDDRPKFWQQSNRIALDVDGVIADFYGAFVEFCKEKGIGFSHGPVENQLSWTLAYSTSPAWAIIHKDEQSMREFFLDRVKPLITPESLPFEPACYVTARHIPSEITMEWIEKHNFPCAEVFSTGQKSKVDILRENKIDRFVDDAWHNFVEINSADIFCYLMDAPYNRKYDVGHFRIYQLSDILTGAHLHKNYPSRYEYYLNKKQITRQNLKDSIENSRVSSNFADLSKLKIDAK